MTITKLKNLNLEELKMGTQNKGIAKRIIIGQTAFLYALWLHWTKGGNGGKVWVYLHEWSVLVYGIELKQIKKHMQLLHFKLGTKHF